MCLDWFVSTPGSELYAWVASDGYGHSNMYHNFVKEFLQIRRPDSPEKPIFGQTHISMVLQTSSAPASEMKGTC